MMPQSPSQEEFIKEIEKIGDNKDNLRRLIDQLRTRLGVIPFVGAGMSVPSGLSGWSDFLISKAQSIGIKQEIRKLIDNGEFEESAERLLNEMGELGFESAMESAFGDHKLEEGKIKGAVLIIPKIVFGPVITTNFDHVLEHVFADCPFEYVVWGSKVNMGIKAFHEDRRFLLKIHGDWEDSTDRIFTKSQYKKHYGDWETTGIDPELPLPKLLHLMMTSRPILFLGCSLKQDHTMDILEQLGLPVAHYAIMEKPSSKKGFIERNKYLLRHNILPIWYPTGKHDQIEPLLEYLAEQIPEKYRSSVIPTTKPNLPQKEEMSFIKLRKIPDRPAHFQPRPEYLNTLKDLVLKDERTIVVTGTAKGAESPKSIGVFGMGGIGKTVLTAELARDIDEQRVFPDGVLWITVGQEPQVTSEQWQTAVSIGENNVLKDKVCLIVLDDVWDVKYTKILGTLGEKCRLIITTRKAEIIRTLGGVEHCVDVLKEDDAMALLADWADQSIDSLPDTAKKVAKECGYLPLALAMAGAMVRGKPIDRWEGILHRLQNADLDKIRQDFPDYQYPDLLKALQVSVDDLDKNTREHYMDFAVFPENMSIPEHVMATFWEPEMDKYDTQEMLDTLVDRSLAQRDKSGQIRLHDLQYDYVRKYAGDMADRQNRFLNAYKVKCPDGWHTGTDDGYFFQHLAYHLAQAEKKDELKKLLLDYRWLSAKLDVTYPNSLIADYSFLPDDHDVQMVQKAIRLSSNSLSRDKSHLAGQLFGRLMSCESNDVQVMLKQIKQCCEKPWICPMKPTLTPSGGPLIRTLEKYSNSVSSVAITPDGHKAVSASSDNTLKVWDIETGDEVRILKGHSRFVNSVAITPDGHKAVSASNDNTLKVWDITTGDEIRTLEGHSRSVRSVAITPDGRKVVSASYDKTLKVWDIETGDEIRTLEGHSRFVNSVAITPDGHKAISASSDKTLKVWDIETGDEIRILEGHSRFVNSVAITPDGHKAVSASKDKTLKVWDITTGDEIRTLKGHSDSVLSVAITSDGCKVVSASNDNTLKVWDIETGDEVRILKGHSRFVNSVAITPDGHKAVSASDDRTLKVWDIETGDKIRTLKGHSDYVYSVAITPDGHKAVSASDDNTLKVWNIETGDEIRTLEGHTNWVNSVAITPDGHKAVSASSDNTLKVWDIETGDEIRTLKGHSRSVRSVAITPDGHKAVSASNDNTLKVWDIETGEVIASFCGDSQLHCCAVAPDGVTIVAGEQSGRVHFLCLIQ